MMLIKKSGLGGKALALILVAAMALGLAVTALAEDEPLEAVGNDVYTEGDDPVADSVEEQIEVILDDASVDETDAVPAATVEGDEPYDPAESLGEMEAALPDTLPDTWHDALVAVACSQLGYEPDGSGYTRYADWCANWAADYCTDGTENYNAWSDFTAYEGDWDAAFVTFCLYYAGIPAKEMSAWPTAELWADNVSFAVEEYDVQPGDLVFLDWDDNNNPIVYDEYGEPVIENDEVVRIPTADHIGIVSYVGESIWAIVNAKEVELSDGVLGYAELPERPVEEKSSEINEASPEENADVPWAHLVEVVAPEFQSLSVEQVERYSEIWVENDFIYLTMPDMIELYSEVGGLSPEAMFAMYLANAYACAEFTKDYYAGDDAYLTVFDTLCSDYYALAALTDVTIEMETMYDAYAAGIDDLQELKNTEEEVTGAELFNDAFAAYEGSDQAVEDVEMFFAQLGL